MKTVYLTFLLMIFTGTVVFGQVTKSESTAKPVKSAGQNYAAGTFVDKDNNGTCDNYENRGGRGRGGNFVDADGDGVCDRRSGNRYRQGNRGKNAVQGCRRGGNTPNRGGRFK